MLVALLVAAALVALLLWAARRAIQSGGSVLRGLPMADLEAGKRRMAGKLVVVAGVQKKRLVINKRKTLFHFLKHIRARRASGSRPARGCCGWGPACWWGR